MEQIIEGGIKIGLVLLGLFALSTSYYLLCIFEYNLNRKKMINILKFKLDGKIRELAKQHNVEPRNVEIAYNNERFFYRIKNQNTVLKEAEFTP